MMRSCLLVVVFSLAACASPSGYVMPPNGGAIVFPNGPSWLTGTRDLDGQISVLSSEFPALASSGRLRVEQAGFWLSFQHGEMQAIYEFSVAVAPPFDDQMYTRMILEDPSAPSAPFVYEHHLVPGEGGSKGIHGPLRNVELAARYTLAFEVYADPRRSRLVERIEQEVQSSFENTSGCIEPDRRIRPLLLAGNAPDGSPVPTHKLMFPCRK